MNETKQLSRLESVPLRDYWDWEDTDFTPWFADPVNISLLGDVLGLERNDSGGLRLIRIVRPGL